jgi:hypothetical protein
VVLLGAGTSLARLLWGLAVVWHYRRVCRPVTDAGLCAVLEELRNELGVRPRVGLRVLDGLGSPATVGWRRPLVLLPADWPTWTDAERRGVLAHELAHVRRGDYATALLAHLAVALHAYHPLVRVLARHLHAAQELAADAVAARSAGDSGSYVRTLCRLALRQDDRALRFAAPARTLLAARVSLLRRIGMLRNGVLTMESIPNRPRRFAGGAALAALGLAVAGLRGPASAEDKAEAPTKEAATQGSPASDHMHRYLRPGAAGAWSVRPAAALRYPSTRLHAAKITAVVGDLLKQSSLFQGKDGLGVSLAAAEECGGEVQVQPRKHNQPGTGSVTMGIQYVRLVEGHDAAAFMTRLYPSATKEALRGGSCYVVPKQAGPFGGDMVYFLPDRRTAVIANREQIQDWLANPGQAPPARSWDKLWSPADRSALAVLAMDVAAVRAAGFPVEENAKGENPFLVAFVTKVNAALFVAADAEEITLVGRAALATPADAAALALTALAAKQSGAAVRKMGVEAASAETGLPAAVVRWQIDLLTNLAAEADGAVVRGRTHGAMKLGDLLKLMIESTPD